MLQAQRRFDRSNVAQGGTTGSADVRALIAALGSDDGAVRLGARKSLVAVGKQAVLSLMEALRDPSEHVRWEAAKSLAVIQDKASAGALVVALEDKSFGIRWLAAEGLVALKGDALPPLLRTLMKRADSVWLREGALHVLHRLAKLGLGDETRLVVAALEGLVPTIEVPLAAGDAFEKLRGARRLRGSPKKRWLLSRPVMRRGPEWSGLQSRVLGSARIGKREIFWAAEG